MDVTGWLRFDRWTIAAAIVLTGVIFTAQAADPVNVIKMTALVLCAITLLASCAMRVVRTRIAQVPWSLASAVGVALLLALVLATITAPVTTTAVLGAYGRNAGLLTYASVLVLFLVGLRVLERRNAGAVLVALITAGAFTAAYGLLQRFGDDPVPWNNPFNPIIGSLGNPNFAAAYMAICTPAAVWGALRTSWNEVWRGFSALVAVMCVAGAFLSEAAQGPLALAPGLAVLLVAWLLNQRDQVRKVGLGVVGAVGALGLAGLAAGIAGVGPAASVFGDAGSKARLFYWDAALAMFRESPVVGVGLDTYGGYWRTLRSPETITELAGSDFSDSAHSVPLHLLATGGTVLGLTYVAFVGVVASALVVGLLRLNGQDRLLLGGLGGSWVAYQVQSWVSIDQVPLTVTQYALAAGVVVVAGWSRLREFRLPGAPPVPVAAPKGRRVPVQRQAPRELAGADYALMTLLGLVTAAALWQSLVPLRGNVALANAQQATADGDRTLALAEYEEATELVPGMSLYWQKKGEFFQGAQRPDLALQAYEKGYEVNRLELDGLRVAASLAEGQDRIDDAREMYREAVALDPLGPNTILPAAQFELRHDGATRARGLLEDAVVAAPMRADVWAVLGDARLATGDAEQARAAYERAVELEPGQPTAVAGLATLTG